MAEIVSIEPLQPKSKIRVPLSRFMTLALTADTVLLTPNGERTLAQNPSRITGYCNKNPKNLLIRDIEVIRECKEAIEVVRLTWDAPDYIWTDGILVGAKWTS
jgi:spore coat polysaccharide biosynthesis protein SpsF (cytidylyltransferase family)